jgi:hypothetical protein
MTAEGVSRITAGGSGGSRVQAAAEGVHGAHRQCTAIRGAGADRFATRATALRLRPRLKLKRGVKPRAKRGGRRMEEAERMWAGRNNRGAWGGDERGARGSERGALRDDLCACKAPGAHSPGAARRRGALNPPPVEAAAHWPAGRARP